jgi:ketosteroid isomerase-like protein
VTYWPRGRPLALSSGTSIGGTVPIVASSIPAAIADFIEATNRGDSAAFVDTFAPDATLNDWGTEFHGRDAIAGWNQTDNIGVQAHFDVVEVKPADKPGTFVATLTVTSHKHRGTGPMTFVVDGNKIRSLEITPAP